MLKRYLVFAGAQYHPFGGWEDFQGSFDSLDEATERAASARRTMGTSGDDNWSQIIDTQDPGHPDGVRVDS